MRSTRLILITILGFLLFITCEEPTEPENDHSFAIYIADEASKAGVPLDALKLLEIAFLSVSDITTYRWGDHHISYSESVYKRLKTWGSLINRIFVVTVENKRIYWGMFKDDVDSGGCQNPVIMLLPRHPERNTIPPSVRIERAYPEYFGSEEDPDLRADPRIYYVLEKAGVLIP